MKKSFITSGSGHKISVLIRYAQIHLINAHADISSEAKSQILVCAFIHTHSLSMEAVKALASLCICTAGDKKSTCPLIITSDI